MTEQNLPPVPALKTISDRLQLIFPEGVNNRQFLVRDIAARTIFVMFYAGAIAGMGRWIRPNQVVIMTDAQAARVADADRLAWLQHALAQGTDKRVAGAWYADNSREPIRDETLRRGLIPTGAVVERSGLPTTSALPKYALEPEFASLFDETVDDEMLRARILQWQEKHLSKGALTRAALLRQRAAGSTDSVRVTFPNGESRLLSPGPSSEISKGVVEEFAPRFLHQPAVLWLSEPGNKVVARDDALAREIGIVIAPDRNLPDLILVDTGAPDILLVFVEVVATDGPVDEQRRAALLEVATSAGFGEKQVAFVTAFADRARSAYRRAVSELAWGSFVWFRSEPDRLMILGDFHGEAVKLADLLSPGSSR